MSCGVDEILGCHLEAAGSREERGATALQAAVLRQIDRRPGVTVGEVHIARRMLSSNVSRALRGLEAAGYVRREADAADARRLTLHPTGKASENLARLQSAWSGLLARGPLTDAQLDDLRIALELIEHHLPGGD